jgi:hypothetical protein
LLLKYETGLPISDVASLEREVDEIWRGFQIDVENAQMKNAIISATSHSSGGFVSRTWLRLPS